jgi:hypothetical protein
MWHPLHDVKRCENHAMERPVYNINIVKFKKIQTMGEATDEKQVFFLIDL